MKVLVTGFGPFRQHTVNPSWEAVKKVPNTLDSHSIKKQHLQVEYSIVKEFFSAVEDYDLFIHVGVGLADHVQIETVGNNTGYIQLDNQGLLPLQNCCVVQGPPVLTTSLPCELLVHNLQQKGHKVLLSTNAGRFLCEFTLYSSLYRSHQKSVFVHLPPVGLPYSQEELDQILLDCVTELLQLTKR
jgi:pyroglutamyl-peptidase